MIREITEAIRNGSPLGKAILIVGGLVLFTILYFIFRNLDIKGMFGFIENLPVK